MVDELSCDGCERRQKRIALLDSEKQVLGRALALVLVEARIYAGTPEMDKIEAIAEMALAAVPRT